MHRLVSRLFCARYHNEQDEKNTVYSEYTKHVFFWKRFGVKIVHQSDERLGPDYSVCLSGSGGKSYWAYSPIKPEFNNNDQNGLQKKGPLLYRCSDMSG